MSVKDFRQPGDPRARGIGVSSRVRETLLVSSAGVSRHGVPDREHRSGGRGGVRAANTRGREQWSFPGGPGSELLQRSQRRALQGQHGQGAELPALTGTRAAGAFSRELPSGRARRPAPPRPSRTSAGRRPSLPTSYCLSSSPVAALDGTRLRAGRSSHFRLSLGGFWPGLVCIQH